MTAPSDAPGVVSDDVTGIGDQAIRLVRVQHALKAASTRSRPDKAALSLLFPLHDRGPMRAGAVAEALHADPSTISRHVSALLAGDLVRREADPGDGRASLLAITDAGRATCLQLRAHRNDLVAELLADWDPGDVATLHHLLRRLNDCFEAAVPMLTERMAGADPHPPLTPAPPATPPLTGHRP